MRRQGRADRSNSAGWKSEPDAKAISVKTVSQIGTSLGNHITGKGKVLTDIRQPLHEGRGYNAPGPTGRTIHSKGSQGSH